MTCQKQLLQDSAEFYYKDARDERRTSYLSLVIAAGNIVMSSAGFYMAVQEQNLFGLPVAVVAGGISVSMLQQAVEERNEANRLHNKADYYDGMAPALKAESIS